MKMSAPLTIRAVTSLEEFKGLACEWEQLLRTVPGHSVFLTWEWLYYWAKHYLGGNRLKILLAFDQRERLVGIAPFYLRRTKAHGVIPLRELRVVGSEVVCSSYLDVIVSAQHKPALLQSLYRYLFNEAQGEWDILTFADVPAESSTLDLWNELFAEAGKVGEVVSTTCCPVIRLSGDLETYRASLGRNRRYTLQRKMKRLDAAGRVQYSRAACPSEVGPALNSLITLHQQRWSQGSTGGVFADERTRKFHRDVVQVFSERGRVSLDLLELDGRPIAGIYGLDYQGVYYFYLPGFDPAALPKASPGLLLLYHRIEQAIHDGERMVDLLQGAQPYKLEWSNDVRRLITCRYYNRHAPAVALKLLESAKRAVKILLR